MPLAWIVEVGKSFGSADPSRMWVNRYELLSAADVQPQDMKPVADIIVAAERNLHYATTFFLQYRISTWAKELGGYNPLAEVTVGQSLVGTRTAPTTDNLDLNVAYMVRFNCDTGRTGRRFYRGGLAEGDVSAVTSGTFQLASGSTLAQTGSAFTAYATALAPLLPGGNGAAKLYLIGDLKSGLHVERPVTSVTVGGIVINRRNHKWFNRKKVAVQ